MEKITLQQILILAPNTRQVYRDAFVTADAVLAEYHINDTGLRLAHFMAQILHESGGFTIFEENMNYSAERMTKVWPSRFPTVTTAVPFAHNPQKLANKVYNDRMGNAPNSNDGWNYRGRGLLQITGKESYKKYGETLGADFINHPELAESAVRCLRLAALEYTRVGCNPLADQDNITGITQRINGGQTGIAERRQWLAKTKHIWV